MTSKPVALLLAGLGVTKTHSRPYTSDDNPFSEAHFKTLKYRPNFPERFGSIEDARVFCQAFFSWYNTEHRHSGVGLMRPAAVHTGRASAMRDARQGVLMIAYAVHPERFVRKTPEPPVLPDAVWINPPKKPSASQEGAGATISIADDHRVELNMEGFGVASESTGNVRHPVAAPTHEVLHEMPTASVPNSLTRSARWLVKTSVLYASPPPSPEDQTRVSHFQLIEFWVERPAINSFFLNKLREVGCIHYKGRMEAHSPLLDIALHD